MRTALALRHLHFEDLGTLDPLLSERGYQVRYVDAPLADLASVDAARPDLLVALGGPIGAFDDGVYPYIADVLALLRRRLDCGRPLLGICLGAQLMARALGAAVAPMPRKEIGFGELRLTAAGQRSTLAALAGVPVLHWHGDRFELPADATPLAGSDACDNQAFSIGGHALALQFHLEADATRIESWLVGHACELAQAGIDPRELRRQACLHGAALAQAARRCIGGWLDRAESPIDAP